MRCLTNEEAHSWLKTSGISISDAPALKIELAATGSSHEIQVSLTQENTNLWRLAERLANWLPHSGERLLWLRFWETYPPGQLTLLENARLGSGQDSNVMRRPWHLFEATTYIDYDARSPEAIHEEGFLTGVISQVMSFEWDAVLFARGRREYISISDGFGLFVSQEARRIEEVKESFKRGRKRP
jgi:hypothetical protein